MTVQELVARLDQAGGDLHVEDLLDALWLATRGRDLRLHGPAPDPRGIPERSDQPPEAAADVSGPQAADGAAPSPPGPQERKEDVPLFGAGRVDPAQPSIPAAAVAPPAARPLPGRLQLARALRPLRTRRPSATALELDEAATVEASAAHRGALYPVFRPVPEPWFDAHVVLEDDPAITLWRDTLADFCRMLEDTGAFRAVASWRLRGTADGTGDGGAWLEGPTGFRAGTRLLAGRGVPRLVFFATHGGSASWLDGCYARLLAPWARAASLVILDLFERDGPGAGWPRGALGEPHGTCAAREPGAATADFQVSTFWWRAPPDPAGLVPIPGVPLTPAGLGDWARTLMGRGRTCPVYLLDPAPPPGADSPRPDAPDDLERAAALLWEASPAAFRLAVALACGPFTIPVARVLQQVQQGPDAPQSDLAAVLLSGLFYVRSPTAADGDPNERWFACDDAARRILLRSLTEAETLDLGEALEDQVSRYLERIEGRSVRFRALVPDAAGRYRLPEWAQPFARLGLALMGADGGKTAAQRVEELAGACAPAVLDGLLEPSAPAEPTPFRDRLADGSPGPEMVWLPGSRFRMGSPAGVGSDYERPTHEVRLSHYGIGKYPVTVGEFRRFCEATGYRTEAEQGEGAYVRDKQGGFRKKLDANWHNSYMDQDDRHPVVCISWNDAQAYCDWLSKETGETYGLLTEAQWEHACRAGTEGRYCFGDAEDSLADYAWYSRNAADRTHPVGAKLPNIWGLHDLHGNVWEWCRDWYSAKYYQKLVDDGDQGTAPDQADDGVQSTAPRRLDGTWMLDGSVILDDGHAPDLPSMRYGTVGDSTGGQQPAGENPNGSQSGSERVCRGGAWDLDASACRSAYRGGRFPSERIGYLGFRLSRTGPLSSYPFTLARSGEQEAPKPAPIPGLRDPLKDGTTGPAMVWLPGGTFTMGQDDSPYADERPAHPVRVDACSIGQYPVTFAQYDRFCAATGRERPADQGWGRGARPAINVSWDDAQAYCNWLSMQTGETYGLATEAQWEYACRAGTATRWSCGDDESALGDYAWHEKNAEGKTHPVGEKRPNDWHFYDMHGNVWEWCRDWWSGNDYQQLVGSAARTRDLTAAHAHSAAAGLISLRQIASGSQRLASENPTGPRSGSDRVCRGGAWGDDVVLCRSACRNIRHPSSRYDYLGFRLSRTGPWHSYPLTLGRAAAPEPDPATGPAPADPAPPGEAGPAVPRAEPRYDACELFRDRFVIVGADGTERALDAPDLVYLPGGTFRMGDALGQSNERPVHLVRLDAFALGRTPVTWGQYRHFCEATDRHWPQWLEPGGRDQVAAGSEKCYAQCGVSRDALELPVVGVSWDDAVAYCAWLSERTGQRYLLPTEAQWEYACRAGTDTRWSCGDEERELGRYAWHAANAGGKLHPVGQKPPNPCGIHDQHGNCWEWCADWYARNYYETLAAPAGGGWLQRTARALGLGRSGAAAATGRAQQALSENPSGPESGSYRVCRGGAWKNDADLCRSAYRYYSPPFHRRRGLGFRLSRTV